MKNIHTFSIALVIVVFLLMYYLIACAGFGSVVDEICIFGQVTPREAEAINKIREEEHAEAVAKDPNAKFPYPDHCIQATPPGQHGGDTDCRISDRTRYTNGACSGAIKRWL